MINGILNVCKEPDFTSNDVVAKLRGILRQKKIGHAGTLDPAATGVLPVLLGSGTRLSEYLMDHTKTYRTILLLGVATDTQDMTGSVTASSDPSGLSEQQVRDAVLSFKGEYDQLPPMYSARKVNGKKLYDLAREGKVVERRKVTVRISDIRIESVDLPEVVFSVDCSKGTYIRTLCHDIGQKLGCGGAMKELRRTRVGDFYLEDSVTLSEIEELVRRGRLDEKVIPVEEMFLNCLRVRTEDPYSEKLLLNGNALTTGQLKLPSRGAGDMIRLCTHTGEFTAVYQFEPEKGRYVPYRMFGPS